MRWWENVSDISCPEKGGGITEKDRQFHHLYIYIDRWWYRWWNKKRMHINHNTTSTTSTTCYALLTWVCLQEPYRKDFRNGCGGGGVDGFRHKKNRRQGGRRRRSEWIVVTVARRPRDGRRLTQNEVQAHG